MRLLLATGNPGKVREMAELFRDLPMEIISLADLDNITEVPENGSTFEENAMLKASGYSLQTGFYTLADDSGLEVDALGGAPGVMSARYGGDVGHDKKMEMLLEALRETNGGRDARFRCCMAFAGPNGKILSVAEGVCTGSIAEDKKGSGGFGYDPIFIPSGYAYTFGELDEAVKQNISHRKRASETILRYLLDFTAV